MTWALEAPRASVGRRKRQRAVERLVTDARDQLTAAREQLPAPTSATSIPAPEDRLAIHREVQLLLARARSALDDLRAERDALSFERGRGWIAELNVESAVSVSVLARQLDVLRVLSEAAVLYRSTNDADQELIDELMATGETAFDRTSHLLDRVGALDGEGKLDALRSMQEDLRQESASGDDFDKLVDRFTLTKARIFEEYRRGRSTE